MSYLDVLVLVILAHEPAHGYEIRRKVERVVSGAVSLNPNVLYPMLHRLENMGAVTKTVQPQAGRPARHVYRLTERGEEILYELLREFGPAEALSEGEFQTRVAFFHLLGPQDRQAILDVREAALGGLLERLGDMKEHDPLGSWNRVVLEHAIEQVELERRWVADLRRRSAGQPAGQPAGVPGAGPDPGPPA